MEARKYEDMADLPPVDLADETLSEETKQLSQEYIEINPKLVYTSWQRKQLSFFVHIALYCMFFALISSVLMAILPALIAIPLGIFLPLGLILGVKYIWKTYIKK